ncbi:MAG TPA: phosphoribosylanthranilate isomerase [Candidatus Binataceae bacterium]|nr:phosphoribosylanthranilate isomerase [Candidatus Binataceae bacterium]
MTVRVKICGVTRADDADAAIEAGAELIGLNFYAPSPRYVAFDTAVRIRRRIGSRAQVVGVFVNAERAVIDKHLSELHLDMLQFHGDEDDSALAGWNVPVIRALRVRGGEAGAAISRARADYILLDTFHPSLYGGSGVARPLDDLKGLDLSRVFISGGLNATNVADAAALHPYAVDAASGVESSPGAKDHLKLRSFVANAKSAR